MKADVLQGVEPALIEPTQEETMIRAITMTEVLVEIAVVEVVEGLIPEEEDLKIKVTLIS
jgi:hypothetical protein